MSKLTVEDKASILATLEKRFEQFKDRHPSIGWEQVVQRLESNEDKLWSLHQMEITGGEPDVLYYEEETKQYIFYDCSVETPKGRRSICYDQAALEARKQHKPANSAMAMAAEMGVEMLSEEQYRQLQQIGKFDMKTSSWLATPTNIRELGGAIFGDYRYGQVFIYHNGADSYYASRGFRSMLRV